MNSPAIRPIMLSARPLQHLVQNRNAPGLATGGAIESRELSVFKTTTKPNRSKARGRFRAQRTSEAAYVRAEDGRFANSELRLKVLEACRGEFANGLGVEIAAARGMQVSEEWDDWWKSQLLGLKSPDDTSAMYYRRGADHVRSDNIRSRLVWSVEQYDMFGLPPREDGSSRYLTRREMAVLSLLCGSWPSVERDEKLSVSQVINREEKLIEKLSRRHGPRPLENTEQIGEYDPDAKLWNYDRTGKMVPNPLIKWTKQKTRRGRRG